MSRKFSIMNIVVLTAVFFSVGVLVFAAALTIRYIKSNPPRDTFTFTLVHDFDTCVKAGNPIIESYPRQCARNGAVYMENIDEQSDGAYSIKVRYPAPNQVIGSPLIVTGEAGGQWFFEGSFPILLFDNNGKRLSIAAAEALEDWRTEDMVPFEAKIEFGAPETNSGKLILRKDNPSGLAENGGEFVVPVMFGSEEIKISY